MQFNAAATPYPKDRLIHELFEEQVACTPNVTAVVDSAGSLTYDELNRRANQLARRLRACGVDSDQLVGICVERSSEMVVGLLGILKAGGAYVPLDPDYPADRLAYIYGDARPSVLLTQRHLRHRLSDAALTATTLELDVGSISSERTDNLDREEVGLHPSNLAYVIYTSGSTGRPKGVMVEHRNVLSLWQGLEHIYSRSPRCQRIAVNASFTFDSSVKQFVQLLSGRTLVLLPQAVRMDASRLLSFVNEYQVEGIDCTPSQLKAWVRAGLLERRGGMPKMVLVGGEAIDPELWARMSRCSEIDFHNVYGPTESTVDATVAHLRNQSAGPNIGHPMENRQIYILDSCTRAVATSVTGEIYIGGAGVARGYLNQPAVTAERFISCPFGDEAGGRQYKTGDLGRWCPDGSIEYVGRNDHQVKIRGHRVELGEIESQIMRYEGVEQATVVARQAADGDRRLVTYVVACDPQNGREMLDFRALREHLRATLPDYMVPVAFVRLDRLPLSPNGKVDRAALPDPGLDSYLMDDYAPPRGELEEAIAGIWRDLLAVERVGRNDSFFDLGGNSLLATRAMMHISDVLDANFQMSALFEQPTVARLSHWIAQGLAAELSMEVS